MLFYFHTDDIFYFSLIIQDVGQASMQIKIIAHHVQKATIVKLQLQPTVLVALDI